MITPTRLIAAVLLSAAALFCSGPMAAERYVLERPHTQILFFVSHLGFSQSQGEFLDFEGDLMFDQGDWSKSSVEVTIRTHSIDMDDHRWDKHLRDKDFFDVTRYPTMTFRSTRVERTSERDGILHGELTLIGQTHPVSIPFHFNKAGVHPLSKQSVAGFSAETRIKRSEFGMSYGLPMVGDEVTIRLEVEAIRQASAQMEGQGQHADD